MQYILSKETLTEIVANWIKKTTCEAKPEEMILWASNNRTDNLNELETDELYLLLHELQQYEYLEHLRNEIWAIGVEIELLNPNHFYSSRLTALIREHSISDFEVFTELDETQLLQLRKIIKALRRKYYKSLAVKASNATKSLLKELNIKTA